MYLTAPVKNAAQADVWLIAAHARGGKPVMPALVLSVHPIARTVNAVRIPLAVVPNAAPRVPLGRCVIQAGCASVNRIARVKNAGQTDVSVHAVL